ncbi:Transposon Tf2-1 polyprotein [Ceratobasidium theobromae]|uniref:Transposon Tf2-1 polyprotein n=1 Tax=Ceratobasidium theobromae TaxID=1582974 RepID=A0A5N5Q971_9AGAM|nr:Transposon Tf2-1 polyprotein [Ceratobasidium theobromae]
MDQHYLETQKAKALEAKYRQRGHEHETPEDYVIRKAKELTSFTDWTDMELMLEVMNGTPESWHVLVNPQRIPDWNTFLDEISWNQQQLMKLGHDLGGKGTSSDVQQQLDKMQSMIHRLDNSQRRSSRAAMQSHQVSSKPEKLLRIKELEDAYIAIVSTIGTRIAPTMSRNQEETAQEAYEDLCYESDEEDLIDLNSESESSESEEDFHEPLKSMTVATSSEKPSTEVEEPQVSLGGNTSQEEVTPVSVQLTKSTLLSKVKSNAANMGEEITLKRLMSRPAGTAFYGCKALIIKGWIQNPDGPKR